MPTKPLPTHLHGRDRGGLNAAYGDIGTEVATDVASHLIAAGWTRPRSCSVLVSRGMGLTPHGLDATLVFGEIHASPPSASPSEAARRRQRGT